MLYIHLKFINKIALFLIILIIKISENTSQSPIKRRRFLLMTDNQINMGPDHSQETSDNHQKSTKQIATYQNSLVSDENNRNGQDIDKNDCDDNNQNNDKKNSSKEAAIQRLQDTMRQLCKTVIDVAAEDDSVYLRKTLSKIGQTIKETIIPVVQTSYDFEKSETFDELQETFTELTQNTERIKTYFDTLQGYLLKELKKPIYKNKTISELISTGTDKKGEPLPGSLWEQAMFAAQAEMEKTQIPRTAIKKASRIEFPLDKLNAVSCGIWNLLEKDTGGQIAFAMEKRHSKKEINLYYSIDFDALGDDVTITKRLTPFDKRVYIAISALFNSGNNIITLTQIYYAMGNLNTNKPNPSQIEKINNSITKMTCARITVDNSQEAEVYRFNRFVYDGSLLPLERGTAIVNGQLADAALHIFREPPIITFAKKRHQITTLDIKLLQSPVNKTEPNLLIDDYLLERISHMKNGKQSNRILLKTLYEKADIKTKNQKSRAPEKIRRYLDYYMQCGFFKEYSMQPDGITIYF